MFTASPFDWSTYRHMFSSEAMEAICDERRTIACWIEVEKAVARAQAEVGIIPPDAADAIQRCGGADRIDLDRLHESTLEVGRPIVGLVAQLAEQVGPGHDVWVHYGVTTYDVMDTGRVLQIRDALGGILEGVRALRQRLASLAEKHRDTVMIGRTNGLHAQPITFGGKLACWIEELSRHDDRLDAASKRALVVQFGGAVGTLASLHPDGMRFRETVAAELGLGVPASNWHNARDSVTEVALCLGNLCATLARIAQNIKSLGSTEIGEVAKAARRGVDAAPAWRTSATLAPASSWRPWRASVATGRWAWLKSWARNMTAAVEHGSANGCCCRNRSCLPPGHSDGLSTCSIAWRSTARECGPTWI